MTKHLKCHSIEHDEDLNPDDEEEMALMGDELTQKAADKKKTVLFSNNKFKLLHFDFLNLI